MDANKFACTLFLPIEVGVAILMFLEDLFYINGPRHPTFRPASQTTECPHGFSWEGTVGLDGFIDNELGCHPLKEKQSTEGLIKF